jgi:hypothetical protein
LSRGYFGQGFKSPQLHHHYPRPRISDGFN